MNIQAMTLPKLEFYRTHCNFVNEEKILFEMRASGHTLEQCCETLHMEVSGVKNLSRKVDAKMIEVADVVNMKKWLTENYG